MCIAILEGALKLIIEKETEIPFIVSNFTLFLIYFKVFV